MYNDLLNKYSKEYGFGQPFPFAQVPRVRPKQPKPYALQTSSEVRRMRAERGMQHAKGRDRGVVQVLGVPAGGGGSPRCMFGVDLEGMEKGGGSPPPP